eukprot:CAMPEP_0171127180 /NCGR_PEP_ID=MMETSP0766_2-20121228/114802_1 /TAXON_ID=439317 /ORGANISM="Gambierdiscus australes, Strain CAWD 149" /LENGTH=473 /DNA_ID=CAMNT_0011590269 /DNA_START=144 /DNA_END=1565 /DNA_ORIENTATION=-
MFHFSGPAVQEIWRVTVVQWTFAISFPFIVCLLSSCPQTWHPFAHYPTYVWLPFFALVGWSLYREAKCFIWVVYTQALYCAPFRIFGFQVTFHAWMVFMLLLGLASHADIVTNGLFLSKILKTVDCDRPTTRTIQRIWASVIEESLVSDLPGFDRIKTLLLLSWGIMFLQPLLAFLAAYPCKGVRKTNYNRGVGPDAPNEGEMNGYVTLCSWMQQCAGSDKKVHHADVLKWVAVVNRMVSITDRTLLWTIQRGKQMLEKAKANEGPQKQEGIARVYDMLSREFSFNLYRLLLVNLFEKSCMLEAQTTIFAISRCMMPPGLEYRIDPQMLLSVLLSFLTFFKTIADAVEQLFLIRSFWLEIAEEDTTRCYLIPMQFFWTGWQLEWHLARYGCEPVEGLPGPAEDILRKRRRLYLLSSGFLLVALLLVWVFLHCCFKFVMAFVCTHSLWNIPTFRQEPHMDYKGCVDLSRFLGYG